jgi:hypothetical protein
MIRASSRSCDGGLKKPMKPMERGCHKDDCVKAGVEPATCSGSSLACPEGGCVM